MEGKGTDIGYDLMCSFVLFSLVLIKPPPPVFLSVERGGCLPMFPLCPSMG